MPKWNWAVMDDQQKIRAIQKEMELETHNGITKEDLVNMLRWLWEMFEIEYEAAGQPDPEMSTR